MTDNCYQNSDKKTVAQTIIDVNDWLRGIHEMTELTKTDKWHQMQMGELTFILENTPLYDVPHALKNWDTFDVTRRQIGDLPTEGE